MHQRMMVANGSVSGVGRTGPGHVSDRKKRKLTLSVIIRQVLPTSWSSRRSLSFSCQKIDTRAQSTSSVGSDSGVLGDEEKTKLYNRQFDPYG